MIRPLEAAARAGVAIVAMGGILGVLGLMMVVVSFEELRVWVKEQRR